MTRREVLELCYAAHTKPEMLAAMEARSLYLAEHPADGAVLDIGSMLTRHLEALQFLGVDEVEPATLPVVADKRPAGVV